jgi:cell shape-determining protein MreD
LLFSLAAGLQLGTWPGMFVGFAAGVILGALGAHDLTMHVVTCTTAGFVGGLMSERLHVDRFAVPAIAAGAFSLAAWPAQALLTGQSLPTAAVLTGQAAYNSLLSPLFFQIARVARSDRSR